MKTNMLNTKEFVLLVLILLTAAACAPYPKAHGYSVNVARSDYLEREYRGLIAFPKSSVGNNYQCEPGDYSDSDQLWPAIAYPMRYPTDIQSLTRPQMVFTPMSWVVSTDYEERAGIERGVIGSRYARNLKAFLFDTTQNVLFLEDECFCHSRSVNGDGIDSMREYRGHLYIVRAVVLKYVAYFDGYVSAHRNVSCIPCRSSYYEEPMLVGAVTEIGYLDVSLPLPDTIRIDK